MSLLLLSTGCTYACRSGALEVDDSLAEAPRLQGRFTRHTSSFDKDPDLQLLRAARNRVEAGDPFGAIDLLQAKVGGMSTVGKVALGNQILGDAQMMLGHARLAGAYYAHAYAAEPSAQRLWLMASANDDSGDYELALGQYLELVSCPGPEADEYRQTARWRIGHIIDIIGTPTPVPRP